MPGPDVSERMRNEGLPLSFPFLSCPSAPALTSSSKSSWGWVGGPFPTRALRGQTIPPPRLWRAPHEPCGGGARWGMASAPPSRLRLHGNCTWGGVYAPPFRVVWPSGATLPARASSLPSACGSPRPRTSRRGSGAVLRSPACCGSGTPDGRCRPSPRR